MAWLTGWNFRKKITIQDAYVDSDLVDFPFYVKIDNDADFYKARTDGYDIRFTLSDGKTLLKYECEHWTGGNGSPATAHFWVKAPSILAIGGVIIYIYYGKPDAPDGQDAPNVWDANFKGVWHMKDKTPSTIADSTGVNDGTKLAANEPIEADGKVYKGQHCDGENDFIRIAAPIGLDSNIFLLEYWICDHGQDAAYERVTSRAGDRFETAVGIDGSVSFYPPWTNTGYDLIPNIGTHLAFRYDGSIMKVFANAEEVYSGSRTINPAGALRIARREHVSVFESFNGLIDEVRISNIVRSLGWLKFEVHNINEADHELTWGDEEGILYSERLMDAYLGKRINLFGSLEEKLDISGKMEEKMNLSGFLEKKLDMSGKTEEALVVKGVLKKTIKEELR